MDLDKRALAHRNFAKVAILICLVISAYMILGISVPDEQAVRLILALGIVMCGTNNLIYLFALEYKDSHSAEKILPAHAGAAVIALLAAGLLGLILEDKSMLRAEGTIFLLPFLVLLLSGCIFVVVPLEIHWNEFRNEH